MPCHTSTRMHILSCLCIREIYDYRHKIAFRALSTREARKKRLFLDENLEEKELRSVSKKIVHTAYHPKSTSLHRKNNSKITLFLKFSVKVNQDYTKESSVWLLLWQCQRSVEDSIRKMAGFILPISAGRFQNGQVMSGF